MVRRFSEWGWNEVVGEESVFPHLGSSWGDGVFSPGQKAQTVSADLELEVRVWPNACCVCACKPEKQMQLLLAVRCHVLPQTENLLFLPIPADTVSDTVTAVVYVREWHEGSTWMFS